MKTRAEILLQRNSIREKAQTVQTVAGAVALTFCAAASVAVAITAFRLMVRFWG